MKKSDPYIILGGQIIGVREYESKAKRAGTAAKKAKAEPSSIADVLAPAKTEAPQVDLGGQPAVHALRDPRTIAAYAARAELSAKQIVPTPAEFAAAGGDISGYLRAWRAKNR
ncbi:MAG: hypothetical protein ACYCUI_07800 [Vulcanimicrobiaceae bacterium]